MSESQHQQGQTRLLLNIVIIVLETFFSFILTHDATLRLQAKKLIDEKVTFETFFQKATINPNAHLIKGVICGYRIEEIENPLTQQVRFLDKLVDELAKGRKMEKILRT